VRISGNNCSFTDNIVAHSAIALYLSNSKNDTMENNMFYNCSNDVIIDEVLNSTFKNNIITDCRKMFLIDSDNNLIAYNQIINTSSGFYMKSSSYNTIIGNDLSSNGNEFYAGFGLLLEGSSCFNLIKLNHIYNNTDEGVWLYSGSNNNTIKNNFISSNMIGVFFGNGIVDNKVYHNNFFNNIQYNARDYGMNVWDNGYPSGGNYWDDYTGIDQDNDGIGDTPYDIIGGSNQDLFPFMNEDGWIKVDLNQSTFDRGFPIRHAVDGDWAAAQSFTPTTTVLSYVKIYLRSFGTPEFNLTIELRQDHPEGTLVDTLTFIPEEVPSVWQWFQIDFDDIIVEPDNNLFIVIPSAPIGVTTSFGYEWGYAFGNQYDEGSFWFTRDAGGLWRDLPTMYEFVFMTYGYY
jgi:parallel beta-helix repeat protein